jgi:hypothetical protein
VLIYIPSFNSVILAVWAVLAYLGTNEFKKLISSGDSGIDECLKEVEIALLALGKPFNILDEFTY